MNNERLVSRVNLILAVVVLVLLNLVAANSYLRLDLTANDSYSLSPVSRETLARADDPLRVKVFYHSEVPAPYNGVRQYLLDLLREFDTVGSDSFSYEVVDTASEAGRREAQQYGLQQVEIQEVRSDEFASRAVYMGAAVLYGTVVERVDQLTSTDGLEYRLTTAMRSAITQVDTLSAAAETVSMRVFASPSLAELQIQGLAELETQMIAIHERINRDTSGRIDFEYVAPDTERAIDRVADEFGVEPVRWRTEQGETRRGLLEIVLTHGERVERIPLEIYSGVFGGYSLAEPGDIEETVRQGLRSLVTASPRVAYSVSAGEKRPDDMQQGAGPFAQLLSDSYELVTVDLAEEGVPPGIETLILNGPTEEYSMVERYRIDQFVMAGGSVLAFVDRHVQIIPTQQEMMAGAQPTWEYNETGLTELIEHWGARVGDAVVLDEESFVSRGRDGQQQLYQAPVISGDGLNRELAITAGLEDVIVLNATEILPVPEITGDAGDAEGTESTEAVRREYIPVLRTSRRSWTVATPSEVGPWISGAPQAGDTAPREVAVLLRGTFTSLFDAPPEDVQLERYRGESVEPSQVMVISSSALTTAQMLNPQGRTPNGTFLVNAVDYLSGAPGMAELRSKGLGVARLREATPAARAVARWGNTVLVPLLVVVVGLVVWSRRRARSRRIENLFADGTVGEDDQ
ncbi:MAG TPA: Gldg family protein [Alkalispirochaeta sp.]|nr:Gldg family protein [Alkalispirochaeta sp.]